MQQTANLHQFLAAGFDPKSIAPDRSSSVAKRRWPFDHVARRRAIPRNGRSVICHYANKQQWHPFRSARRVCRSKTRALLLTLTDPPCGRTSQGMARLPIVGFVFRPHENFPLDPANAICPRITRELRPRRKSRRCGRSFTIFEARSINFAIVVYFECMHVECRLALSQLRGLRRVTWPRKRRRQRRQRSQPRRKRSNRSTKTS
jgi:hypothetical protein